MRDVAHQPAKRFAVNQVRLVQDPEHKPGLQSEVCYPCQTLQVAMRKAGNKQIAILAYKSYALDEPMPRQAQSNLSKPDYRCQRSEIIWGLRFEFSISNKSCN